MDDRVWDFANPETDENGIAKPLLKQTAVLCPSCDLFLSLNGTGQFVCPDHGVV